MKVSGNGNAKEFFKKHGVTEAQMTVRSTISPYASARILKYMLATVRKKKYKAKAAQDYKRHIAKLVAGAAHTDVDDDSHEATKRREGWDDMSDGLDRLMLSVSNESEKPSIMPPLSCRKSNIC